MNTKDEPFGLIHERTFEDETAIFRVAFNRKMTIRELIEYATYKSTHWGYIYITGQLVLEYRYGAVITDSIPEDQKDRTIAEMQIHDGYRMQNYHIELEPPVKNELTAFTFHYYSEDGNGHELTIHAPTLNDAVDIFEKTIGDDISFTV